MDAKTFGLAVKMILKYIISIIVLNLGFGSLHSGQGINMGSFVCDCVYVNH